MVVVFKYINASVVIYSIFRGNNHILYTLADVPDMMR